MKKELSIIKIGAIVLSAVLSLWISGILLEAGISALNKPSTMSLLFGVMTICLSIIVATLLGSVIFDMAKKSLDKEENKEKSDNE